MRSYRALEVKCLNEIQDCSPQRVLLHEDQGAWPSKNPVSSIHPSSTFWRGPRTNHGAWNIVFLSTVQIAFHYICIATLVAKALNVWGKILGMCLSVHTAYCDEKAKLERVFIILQKSTIVFVTVSINCIYIFIILLWLFYMQLSLS